MTLFGGRKVSFRFVKLQVIFVTLTGLLLRYETHSNCYWFVHMPCCRHQGNRILTLGEVPKDQVYGVKLKGVSVCFAMLKAVLSGNYVNFGVFRLYGDDALDNALQTFIKLLLSIPHSDLLVRWPHRPCTGLLTPVWRTIQLDFVIRCICMCVCERVFIYLFPAVWFLLCVKD